ncbi:Serine--tRNA ligase [Thermoplasmatales archaeon]|nr:Serine--tRNA ligase [Thermoplasmatales archaeon]
MIDVKLLRENPQMFYDSCRKRFFDTSILDRFFALDQSWRDMLKEINDLKHEKNQLTEAISRGVKGKLDVESEKSRVKGLNVTISELEAKQKEISEERDGVLRLIPNLLYRDVPVCRGDENNALVKYVGHARVYRDDVGTFLRDSGNSSDYEVIESKPASHVDMIRDLDLVDLDRAGKISGARFFFIKNRLFKIEQALINYATDFLAERGFTVLEPPLMINYESMAGATDIETFKDSLYKIEGEDLYLIATSEHAIAAMLKDEILGEDELPSRVAGASQCFRREAGAHGKDTKGIFRVHQFNKVEQFIFCKPEDSWDYFAEILANSEKIYQNLGIPYRVVNVCSGELGYLAEKKYDMEAWFPSQGKFREIVSISNDTDYQARSLGIKYRTKDGNRYVNTLNGTAIATKRILVAIMENFQYDDGKAFKVPDALVPYTGFDSVSNQA